MDKERYKQLLINARLPENAGERLIKLVCDDYNTTENDIQFQYKRVDYFYLKRPVRDLLNLQCSGTIKAKKLNGDDANEVYTLQYFDKLKTLCRLVENGCGHDFKLYRWKIGDPISINVNATTVKELSDEVEAINDEAKKLAYDEAVKKAQERLFWF
ncbi:MAG: hypothetical protein J6Q15_00105 [Clostridia bacterium]|nr:hypothetical protein [Clostridia bacterium]